MAKRTRKERKFPALTFKEALRLAEAIQEYAAGKKVRKLILFEKLDEPPDNAAARRLITASGQYGLTTGSYRAEHLEPTTAGAQATGDNVAPAQKLEARFKLAIEGVEPFNFLYEKSKGNKVPASEVLADYLSETDLEVDARAECVDTFLVNAKFLGLLRTIGGSERLIPIEQAIEEAPQSADRPGKLADAKGNGAPLPLSKASIPGPAPSPAESDDAVTDYSKVCFYISPIGKENSEDRQHADFMMEFIIEPAVKEFDLSVIRADQIGKPGMIGKQVIDHILNARLVIADLSFHNPNVFYELCLRHATRLPTVQLIRSVDTIPFDLNQYRTIQTIFTVYNREP